MERDYITQREFELNTKRLEDEDKRLSKRIGAVEDEVKRIGELTIAIQKLADNMDRFSAEQAKTADRLKALEDVPAENWKTLRVSILTAIGSVIGTAIVAAIITHITL